MEFAHQCIKPIRFKEGGREMEKKLVERRKNTCRYIF